MVYDYTDHDASCQGRCDDSMHSRWIVAFESRQLHSAGGSIRGKEGANDVLSDVTPFLSIGEELLEALMMPGLCESVVVAILFRGRW